MVIQIGALKSGRDADVEADIAAVVEVAHAAGAIVKVIFENAYLTDDEKVRACHLTEAAGGDFVKTSTGFAPTGATHDDLRADARAASSPHIQVKAAGGVRTLDALIEVMALGVTRVGATATATILDDFRARKAGGGAGAAAPAGQRGRGRLLMARRPVGIGMLGSGFIGEFHADGLRYVPDARVVGELRRAARERREAFAARFGSRAARLDRRGRAPTRRSTSSSSRCPNHLHLEAVRAAAAPRQGASPARSRSAGTATEAAEMLRLVQRRRRLPRLPRERRLQRRDDPDARDGRVRRDRPA